MSKNQESFVCERCVKTMKGIVKPNEKLLFYDQVEFMKSFHYLRYSTNASDGSEVAAPERIKLI